MLRRTALTSLLLLAAAVPAAQAQNPWLERRVLHIAHQGGEREAPSNIPYTYEQALGHGADVLEMDVNITKDGQLVVYHDTSVEGRTWNGKGRVNELTLAQLKALDPTKGWPQFKGIATGEQPPPEGFTREDFQIPTLREVLQRYPDVLMNIEIKGPAPDTTDARQFAEQQAAGNDTALEAAPVLAAQLKEFDREGTTIVVSFSEAAVQRFKADAPEIDTAPGVGGTAAFYASAAGPLPGAPAPQHVALQPPTVFNGLVEVPTKDFVDNAHANGLAVHVWLVDDAEESDAGYGKLVGAGVDGIMTDRPSRLEAFLEQRGLRWDEPGRRGERRRR